MLWCTKKSIQLTRFKYCLLYSVSVYCLAKKALAHWHPCVCFPVARWEETCIHQAGNGLGIWKYSPRPVTSLYSKSKQSCQDESEWEMSWYVFFNRGRDYFSFPKLWFKEKMSNQCPAALSNSTLTVVFHRSSILLKRAWGWYDQQ